MAKQVDFFDGAQSSTTPTIGNVDTTNLACYANDAAYEASNAGAPSEGNIYCNTTDNTIRYYNGTTWTELADSDSVQTFTNKTLDGTDATGTNTITNDATDVTYDNTTSGIVATTAQAAIDEVEGRLDTAETDITTAQGSADANTADIVDLRATTGTADGDTNMGTFTGVTISDNVSTKTALQELETKLESLGSPLVLQGQWNANTNTPTLTSGAGTTGHFYVVSVAGTTTIDGESDWQLGDWIVYDGAAWFKQDNSQTVDSVNGQTGAVSLALNDLTDVNDSGTVARAIVRRNSANTSYEDFNPNQVVSDSTSGSNATLSDPTNTNITRLTNAGLVSVDMIDATIAYSGVTAKIVNATANVVTINNETGATAAERILTGTGGPLELAPEASIWVTYDGVSSRWRIIGGSGSGGAGVSGIITENNSTSDSTIGDWVTYADAAGTTPVDGTGGSPNILLARTTTVGEILQGKGSFELTKGAFNRQGEGVSLDVEVPRYIRGQAAQISFSYQATANFDFGSAADPVGSPSDISVHLYDVTNSKLLTPNVSGIFGGGLFKANIQIPSNCEDIRVILHIATTSALAYDFIFDRVQLDVSPNEVISNMSDWVDWTPTGSWTTNTTYTGKYRQVGGEYQYRIHISAAGAVDAAALSINLPSGHTIDTNKLNTINQDIHFGRGLVRDNATASHLVYAGYNSSTTSVAMFVEGVPSAPASLRAINTVDNLNPMTWASGDSLDIEFSVPIVGLTSGTSHPASIGLNAQAVFRGVSGSATVTGVYSNITFTAEEDTLAGWSTNTYTVNSPGYYNLSATIGVSATYSAGNVLQGSIYNSTTATEIGFDIEQYANTAAGSINFSVSPQARGVFLNYGDQIVLRTLSTGATPVLSSVSNFSIVKIGSERQPYAPRVAYVKDVKVANTSGGTFTSGAWQTRDLNTLSGDQTFISISTNQFTLQPGTYDIEAVVPGHLVSRHKAKLRNITDVSDEIIGSSAYEAGGNTLSPSRVEGRFSISTTKTFEIQHRGQVTSVTNGFGVPSNFGVDEVYTQVKITKVL